MIQPAKTQRRDRRVEYLFPTGEVAEDFGRKGETFVRLSASHDKDRKHYYAALYVEDHFADSVRWEAILGGDHRPTSARVAVEPTARYSAKKLEEFARRALEQVQRGEVTTDKARDILSRLS